MGGNLAWTIRKEDGTEYRMDRWTNIIPNTIDDNFLSGDPKALEDSLKSWLEMKADWEANKDTGNYQHNMTDVYAPYPYGLKPSEYGILVTDFKTKTLISCQGYTNFSSIMPDLYTKERYPERYERYKALFEQGRFIDALEWKNQVAVKVSFDEFMKRNKLVTYDDFLKFIRDNDQRYITVTVKPPEGWTFYDLPEDSRQEAFDKIKALGFELSEDEVKGFEEWIHWDEDEDE